MSRKTRHRHPTQENQKWWSGYKKKIIPFHETMLKPELYTLIKLHKPHHKEYELDAFVESHGHSILRLPPYHPDLNPIELMWATVKQYVAAHNVTFKMEDVLRLSEEKFLQITPESWAAPCDHVKQLEEEYWNSEHALEEPTERYLYVLHLY